MAITETTFSAVSVNGADVELLNLTTEGVYMLYIDLDQMIDGDVFEFWHTEKRASGDADSTMRRVTWPFAVRDDQDAGNTTDIAHWLYPIPITVKHEVSIRAGRISATTRTFSGKVQRVSSGS